MAQKTTLTPYALPGRVYTFSAKVAVAVLDVEGLFNSIVTLARSIASEVTQAQSLVSRTTIEDSDLLSKVN